MMPGEITTEQAAGLTLTALLMRAGQQVGQAITMAESGVAPGHYTASVPAGTPAGIYTVRVMKGSVRVGAGQLDWTGTGERTPASASDVPPAAAVAAAVRSELVPELAAIEGLADAYVDPLSQATASYGPGTAGSALQRLNVVAEPGPVLVVPGAPAITGLCRVFAWLQTPDGRPAARVGVKFRLTGAGPIAAERILSGRDVVVKTNDAGQIVNGQGQPWVDLQRNDMLDAGAPTGWVVECESIGVKSLAFTLTSELVDLRTILLPP